VRVSNCVRSAVRWASFRRKAFCSRCPRPTLEIGPYDKPKIKGSGVFYFDVFDQEELKARAGTEPHLNPRNCPHIHFVSPTGDLGTINRRFKSVFSSHAVEHQPDLVRHLNDVAALLEQGGAYHLIVPDKRYSFDHYRPASTICDVLAAKGRTIHAEATIRRHNTGYAHNNPVLHWLGFHGKRSSNSIAPMLRQFRRGEYVDCHAWQFTPDSFRALMRDLFERGEIALALEFVSDTAFGGIEFRAVLRLRRDSSSPPKARPVIARKSSALN
jgi:hypothetical protein